MRVYRPTPSRRSKSRISSSRSGRIPKPSGSSVLSTKPQQLPLWQLGDAISQLKSSGSNVEALRTAWHAKLAYAASILVMAFVATAIVSWKDNIYIAVTVALLCTFLYFAVYTLGTTLGQRGILHPFLAAWTANLIALFFAFWRLIPLLLRRE